MRISKKRFIGVALGIIVFCIAVFSYNQNREIAIQYVAVYAVLFFITIICIVQGIKEKYLINPFILVAIVPISLMLYDISVSTHYLVALNSNTYYLALYNIAMLVGGLIVGKHIHFSYGRIWQDSENFSTAKLAIYARTFIILGMVPSIIGVVVGLPYLLSFNLSGVKEIVTSVPLASILTLFLYLGVICALMSRDRRTIILVLFALLFSLLLNFSKTTVGMAGVCVLVWFYDLALDSKKLRKYFIAFTAGFVVFIFISFTIYNNIRFSFDINRYFEQNGYMGNVSEKWFLPIMYIISPWSNLQFIVDTTTSFEHGMWLIKPLLGYLQLDGLFEQAYELTPRFQAFNTYTYISVFYRDFGFIGSGICSFALSIYIMWVYKLKRFYKKSAFSTTIFALTMYATFMLFFNNHFQQLSYPYTILILSVFFLVIVKKVKTKKY